MRNQNLDAHKKSDKYLHGIYLLGRDSSGPNKIL